jgi:DNA-binding winged helix-turn-helix (wHTH) protein
MSLEIRRFYRFGDFTVDPDQKVLLRQGRPLPVTPKVFDTLLVLVENGGRIVKKEELMNQVWPDSFVEETNLTFNIQQLRKSLGDSARKPQYIETVPRRGYRFIAKIEEVLNGGNNMVNLAQQPGGFDNQPRTASIESSNNSSISKMPERAFAAKAGTVSAFPYWNKKAIALVIALGLVLAGAGLVVRKFSNRPNQNLRQLVAALPLKIEKLTATGESPHAANS